MKRLMLLYLLVMPVCWACASPLAPVRVYGDTTSTARVVLLNSGNNRISKAVTESFERNTKARVAEFTLGPEVDQGALEQGIHAYQPTVIVALGARAVQFARVNCPNVPLLVGLVFRNQLRESSAATPAGVTLETSVATEFALYRAVMPGLHHVLTFFHPDHSTAFIEQAKNELKLLDIELTAIPVTTAAEMLIKYHDAAENQQVLWMVNDPILLNAHSFMELRKLANAARQPLLCSALREFAVAGAMMVVDIDFSNVGAQLAEMAESVVAGATTHELGLRDPMGGKLIVNMKSATTLGVDVPVRVRPFISELIDE